MNSFGRIFKISIYGESHGQQVGVLIDGCPAGLAISEDDFTDDLLRRKSGAKGTTPRIEDDLPVIVSGVFNGFTTGAPILISFKNKNTISEDYKDLFSFPRPGHADFTAKMKYGGFNDYRGGGHFSGRLTLGLVAAGVIAKKLIYPVSVNAKLIEAGGQADIDKAIDQAVKNNDSIGGIVECCTEDVLIGLGEPFFDSMESLLSHAVFSIPAIKGIEFGSGFQAAKMTGSEHNDQFIDATGKTLTNFSGGINGGITNGNPLIFRVAVKPTSSISKTQQSFNLKTGQKEELKIKGRHDACIALRVPVVIEAITAIVLTDLMLLEQKLPRVISDSSSK
jgi:chorismate synthase